MRSNPRKTPRRGRRQARNLSLLVLFVIALAVLIIISPNEPTKSALNVNAQGQVVSVYEGLVISEAAAVVAEGRITPEDAGIWSDAHAEAWAPIVAFSRTREVTPRRSSLDSEPKALSQA